tara:strand:- start:420 stop:686 length:267 start_codon:yes stop_codon:yes gene_type:complete
MRRSASEVIRNLEMRIAQLEKQATTHIQAKMSYKRWLKKVDDEIGSITMMYLDDLVDYDTYSLWQDGVSPSEAAEIVIENDGTFASML